MAWPADKRFMTPEEFRAHVAALDFTSWKPIGIVWHNTASPTLKRWHEQPRIRWMTNLESYYKGMGWNGGPHLFIDDGLDGIGLFNPLNRRGTHSPSFNAQWIGIEHVGDYSTEDDDAGPGLKVKTNGIIATAILCARLGIPVDNAHIKLHKEDPRTDHDCPGKNMARDKAKSIQAVLEYMGSGGDHGPDWGDVGDVPVGPKPPVMRSGTVKEDGLNMRSISSVSGAIVGVLNKGDKVAIISEAKNGASTWLCIERPHSAMAWVNARYVSESGETVPKPDPAPPQSGSDVIFRQAGKMSTFGGPKDLGMTKTEGLAIFDSAAQFVKAGIDDWLLSASEAGASGLGRRLNPAMPYVACRWDYKVTSKAFLRTALVKVSANGKSEIARAVDWGPNVRTGRAADVSPGLAKALGLNTDDQCVVEVFGKP